MLLRTVPNAKIVVINGAVSQRGCTVVVINCHRTVVVGEYPVERDGIIFLHSSTVLRRRLVAIIYVNDAIPAVEQSEYHLRYHKIIG